MQVYNIVNIKKTLLQDLYLIKMIGMDIILGMTWLELALSIIDYGSKTFLFEKPKLSKKLSLQDGPLGQPSKVNNAVSHYEELQADGLIDIKKVKDG